MLPSAPAIHRDPRQIAKDTFVIQSTAGEGHAPMFVNINSMVIRGAEPIVIDTGGRDNRTNWLNDLFSIVAPEDIRWITVSHDDVDHTGNLDVLLDLAPNATFVSSWFINERMSVELAVPPHRMRWTDNGGTLDIGDRTLSLVRPPTFDSPTTRGVFDPSTGVYWASDAFATPLPAYVADARDLDPGFWGEGMTMFGQAISPWLQMVDDAKFQASVDRVAALHPSTIAGCHTPTITGDAVARAFAITRALPSMPEIPLPGQETLDQIIAMTAAAA
jgi:flavorubredoxin